MKFFLIPLLAISTASVTATPLQPTPPPSPNPLQRHRTPQHKAHHNNNNNENNNAVAITCPPSATSTATRQCTLPPCTDPMFCIQIVEVRTYPCACLTREPTTTVVENRCDSDCECHIPTEWVVETGCPRTTSTSTARGYGYGYGYYGYGG
ncbi:hypothetical protein TWF694_003263 [Orbilia ellipsospora]|uniref:Uncharacterized protein n=1 Tax=Orbilia ellipsospora TaxID=2528407 RepID=A0AAV9X175_9PEZI